MTMPAGPGRRQRPDKTAERASDRGHAAAHGARSIGGTTADRNIVIFGLGLLVCAALFLIPDLSPPRTELVSDRAHARIVSVAPGSQQVGPLAVVELLDADRRGQEVTANLEGPTGQLQRPDYQPGDEVLLAIDSQPDGTVTYSVIDRWRLPVLAWLMAAFALVTIAIAGWRGLRALTSLAITVLVVIRLLIPLLLSGYSPIGLAIGLGLAISVLSFVMTQGISRSTLAAIAGTAVGLLVTGGLAVAVSGAARFTSAQGSEELVVVGQLVGGSIDLSGLLLAAVIFGGLGVLNDVAITQAVTVEEFRAVDPSLSRRELFRRTMSVGIAHLAATVNTLVFAYLGAGLPVVVLLAVQVHRLDLAINDEHIAVEVVRTVVGAIGVLSAVPLTTAIAAWWAGPAGSERRSIPQFLMAHPLLAGVGQPSPEVAVAAAGSGDVSVAATASPPPGSAPPAAEAPAEAPAAEALAGDAPAREAQGSEASAGQGDVPDRTKPAKGARGRRPKPPKGPASTTARPTVPPTAPPNPARPSGLPDDRPLERS
jgi:uncharacterized membrane protein